MFITNNKYEEYICMDRKQEAHKTKTIENEREKKRVVRFGNCSTIHVPHKTTFQFAVASCL